MAVTAMTKMRGARVVQGFTDVSTTNYHNNKLGKLTCWRHKSLGYIYKNNKNNKSEKLIIMTSYTNGGDKQKVDVGDPV